MNFEKALETGGHATWRTRRVLSDLEDEEEEIMPSRAPMRTARRAPVEVVSARRGRGHFFERIDHGRRVVDEVSQLTMPVRTTATRVRRCRRPGWQ